MQYESADCRFVDKNEYCNLLTGFKRLVRVDDTHRGLKGLFDLDTKTLYMIEQKKLERQVPIKPQQIS